MRPVSYQDEGKHPRMRKKLEIVDYRDNGHCLANSKKKRYLCKYYVTSRAEYECDYFARKLNGRGTYIKKCFYNV